MPATYKIMIMGASYGSLLASKLLFGGHKLHLICLPAEADLINAEGFQVRLPVRGRKDPVVLQSRKLPGEVTAGPASGVDPKDYDLVGLAMQEPQYRSPGVRELLDAVAKSRVPCMSIMNMPPLPYIKRIPGLDYEALKPAYTDPTVWDSFDPATITLNSPDPQAIRPPDEKVNVLMVTLPTNFKVARFADDKSTAILWQLQDEIEAIRYDTPEGKIELPVKLSGGPARRQAGRPGAVREIRRRRAKPRASGLRGARAAERRPQHRTRRQAGPAHRQAEGPEPSGDRRRRGVGGCEAGGQPQEGRGVDLSFPLQRPCKGEGGYAVSTSSTCPFGSRK